MDLSPEGKPVRIGKSVRTHPREWVHANRGRSSPLVDHSTALSSQEKLLGRFFSIRTANRHR